MRVSQRPRSNGALSAMKPSNYLLFRITGTVSVTLYTGDGFTGDSITYTATLYPDSPAAVIMPDFKAHDVVCHSVP
jgi:hypothetical protein